MENKKNLVIIIIVLILVILFLGGYITIQRMIINKNENTSTTLINDKEIDLNSFYEIADIMNRFDNAFNDNNSKYLGYPYSKTKIMANKFDVGAALFVSAYSDLLSTNTEQTIPEVLVKGNFERIFGKNLNYSAKNINAGDTYKINYVKDKKVYSYTLHTPKLPYSPGYICKNIKTKLEDDKIIITRKVFFVEYEKSAETGEPTVATIYTNSDKKVRLGQVSLRNGAVSGNEVVAKFGSRIGTYNMTFKYSKDINYNFYMIEKVK